MSLIELDSHAVRQAFDRAAPDYDAHAVLQHEVESRLLERLEFLRQKPKLLLDAGCGTGIASRELSGRYPEARVIGLDWSTAMLGQLRQRSQRPLALCADMHELPLAAGSVDVLFSSLAMQWSNRLEDLLLGFRRVMRPGGMLLFSTFGPDTLRELRQAWAKADDRTHVNLFMDMHDIGDLLLASGFSEPVMDVDTLTLEYPDVISLMRELKAIGEHNAAAGRSPGLTGRQTFGRVLEAYEGFRRGNIYPATFEVVYGVAFGPQEGQPFRTPEGEWAAFSVESLKSRRT